MVREAREVATRSSATARFVWISPYKVREVTALIQGKHVDEARRILAFTPKAASRFVAKVLESAIANAEHNHQIPQEELIVKAAWADEGSVFKRAQPRARGARYLIRRRTSHINVALSRTVSPETPSVPFQPPGSLEPASSPQTEKSRRGTRSRRKGSAKAKEKEVKSRSPSGRGKGGKAEGEKTTRKGSDRKPRAKRGEK